MPAFCAHKIDATKSNMTPAKKAFTGNPELVFNPVLIFDLLAAALSLSFK
jgi:hypothetical protein